MHRLQHICKLNVTMNRDATGWRLESADGARCLSPRLPTGAMIDWLDAFFEGWMTRERGELRDHA